MSAVMKSATCSSGTGGWATKYREPKRPISSRSKPMNIRLRRGGSVLWAMRPRHLEHHRHARGVVVGPRIEHVSSLAQMIEVGRDDHPLVPQSGVGCRGGSPRRSAPGCVPGSLPESPARNWPAKSGSSLSRRNSSTTREAAFRPPSPRRPSISGAASVLTNASSRLLVWRGDDMVRHRHACLLPPARKRCDQHEEHRPAPRARRRRIARVRPCG